MKITRYDIVTTKHKSNYNKFNNSLKKLEYMADNLISFWGEFSYAINMLNYPMYLNYAKYICLLTLK